MSFVAYFFGFPKAQVAQFDLEKMVGWTASDHIEIGEISSFLPPDSLTLLPLEVGILIAPRHGNHEVID